MTDEIINPDGSRNWEANILLDNIKRLEQENKELKHRNENLRIALSTYEMPEVVKVLTDYRTGELQLQEKRLNKYRSALEEIRNDLKEVCKEECDYTKPKFCGDYDCRYGQILNKINEVLNDI